MTERLTCWVTGASAGIGMALANAYAERGYNLVLTARREERLQTLADDLADRYGIGVTVLPADLATPGVARTLLDNLQTMDITVDALVNNAGFGVKADYHEMDWSDGIAMLQVMIVTVTELCHGVLPGMRTRDRGHILNVASLAGLLPGMPHNTLYSACKSFLIKFSESLAAECIDSDIRVTVLCPGYVHTEFHHVMGNESSIKKLPDYWWMTSDQVAQKALQALDHNHIICVPGVFNQSIAAAAQLIPRGLTLQIVRLFSQRFRKGKTDE